MCLPHRCIATSDAPTTENTALLFLRALGSAWMCLLSRCLEMNYSDFQALCHIKYEQLYVQHWSSCSAMKVELYKKGNNEL
jgi:hypothetical protein